MTRPVRSRVSKLQGLLPTSDPSAPRPTTRDRHVPARLWEDDSGIEIAFLPGPTKPVWHAAFSPDGTRIVTVSDDNIARIFRVFPTTQGPIDHARSIVRRELAPCERKRFFLPVGARSATVRISCNARFWLLADMRSGAPESPL